MALIVKPCITEHEQMGQECLRQAPEDTEGITADIHCKKSHRCEPSSPAFVLGQWGWSGNKHPAELFTHGSSLGLITCAVVHPPHLEQIYSKPLKELTVETDASPSHFLPVVCGDAWLHGLWYKGRETKGFCGFCCAQSTTLKRNMEVYLCKFVASYSEWFICVALNASWGCSIKRAVLITLAKY